MNKKVREDRWPFVCICVRFSQHTIRTSVPYNLFRKGLLPTNISNSGIGKSTESPLRDKQTIKNELHMLFWYPRFWFARIPVSGTNVLRHHSNPCNRTQFSCSVLHLEDSCFIQAFLPPPCEPCLFGSSQCIVGTIFNGLDEHRGP